MKRPYLRTVACAALLVAATRLPGTEWGDLRGRFVVDRDLPALAMLQVGAGPCAAAPLPNETVVIGKERSLQNVLVYLRTKDVTVAPRYGAAQNATVRMSANRCRIEPHFALLRTSQTLELANQEPFNVAIRVQGMNAALSELLAPGGASQQKFAKEEALPLRIDSNTHPWMRGWILVRDDPYAAISAADGCFTIRDLPAGIPLVFQFWHEQPGYLKGAAFRWGPADARGRVTLTLQPGENDMGDVSVPAELLSRH